MVRMGKASVSLILVALLAAPALAGNITTFEDGKTGAVVELEAPECAGIINVTVPAECRIRKATVNVSAVIGDGNLTGSPEAVQVFFDNTLIWEFNGTGYGGLGLQDRFIDGAAAWASEINQSGGANGTKVRLPKNAVIRNATLEINCSGRGPIENTMNLTGGQVVSGAGDVNGDGAPDLIIGSRGSSSSVYIYYGGADMDAVSDVTLAGEDAGDYYGYSVAGAGDVNGDGFDDVIVGAWSNDGPGTDAGRAYIYLGGAGMDSAADVILNGKASYDDFGFSVSGAGDVNGDGFGDVVVGALLNDSGGTDAGCACLFLGGAQMDRTEDAVFKGAGAFDRFGYSVSGAGDTDNDGYDDVVVGTDNANRIYIYLGGAQVDGAPDVVIGAPASSGEFGISVSDAGDVNGDGFGDVVAGAPWSHGDGYMRGSAYIFLGGASMDSDPDAAYSGEADLDEMGEAVAGAGDVNGDGFDDVVLGARLHAPGGAVYIHFGGAVLDGAPDAVFDGPSGWMLGYTVSGAGDLDGGGFDDFAAAPYDRTTVSLFGSSAGIKGASASLGPISLWAGPGYLNGSKTSPDFGKALDGVLRKSPFSGVDGYRIAYVDLPVNVSGMTGGNLTLGGLAISYSFEAETADFKDLLNGYIAAHKAEKDSGGNLSIPFWIVSKTPGRVKLAGLSINADLPPALARPIPDLEMNEDEAAPDLFDLQGCFIDDYDMPDQLALTLESVTNASIVKVELLADRYLSADAAEGDQNDNWTGELEVVVAAADHWGLKRLSNPFRIIVRNVNDPPVITGIWPAVAEAGVPYSCDVTAIDGDGDALKFSLEEAPGNMTIDAEAGRIDWMPRARGDHPVSVAVSDGLATARLKASVFVPNKPPRITSQPPLTAELGVPWRYPITFEDANLDNVHVANLLSGDISIIDVTATSAVATMTPTTLGSLSASLGFSDGLAQVYQNFTITVKGNRPPAPPSGPAIRATAGLPYIYKVNATDPDGDVLAFDLVLGPAGMTVDGTTGLVQWTPAGPGLFPVRINLLDGKGGAAALLYDINVTPRDLPRVEFTAPPENRTVRGRVAVAGRAICGTLEVAGVQLRVDYGKWVDAAGAQNWTWKLDTSKLKNGRHTLQARASDGMGYSDTVDRTITVDNPGPGGKGFIPGFDALPLLIAAAALLVLRRKMK